ncbi:chemotaxis protein CheX [Sanguibacter antarcticus]|uniref:Chemotaxis phosphatase CheX-like protein n=1 Tax=Sanguibacter antarcticus TaxID=372484 RepID=A0A2A9E086_9MICO|nr:chemotaxis protein CheX [Sanguibacter antarcticus]PFG32264.1 chemotaxis phosphatase CheX-like protein [Sanguibacter antarcticus]
MIAGTLTVDRDQILAISQDVFAAMIDGGETIVFERFGAVPEPADPIVAWVDMTIGGLGIGARAVVRTGRPVADELTRALLVMNPDEVVTPEDLADAFGEIANVVGGNVKSLLAAHAVLSLPAVASEAPAMAEHQFLQEIPLDWRGHVLVMSLWSLS